MNEIQEELKKQKLEELNAFEQSITDKINLAKEKANQSVYEMIKVLNKASLSYILLVKGVLEK